VNLPRIFQKYFYPGEIEPAQDLLGGGVGVFELGLCWVDCWFQWVGQEGVYLFWLKPSFQYG
jgi:hypothetical protein